MRLVPDWRFILRHAKSIRWMLIAMLFSGAEAAYPFFTEALDVDPRWFGAIIFVLVGCAFASRIIAQKAFENDGQ